MNFLLHHAVALRHTRDPSTATSSMLPDLWRMACRRARLGSKSLPLPDDTRDAWNAGLLHHARADAWFHRDPVFLEGELRAAEAVRALGPQIPKVVLFAHPLWELCLDGALIRRQGFDTVMADMRASRAAATQETARRFTDRSGLATILDDARALGKFHSDMDGLWDALCEGPWLAAYASADGLAECVLRMRRRFDFGGVADSAHRNLSLAIEPLQAEADRVLDRVLGVRPGVLAPAG